MKRLLTLLFVATLWVGCLSQGDGTGIRNSQDWAAFAEAVNRGESTAQWEDASGVIRLRKNLNLNRLESPVAVGNSAENSFRGTFDGGNYTISGLRIQSDGAFVGLFGVNQGTIRRLKVADNCRFEATNEQSLVGAVCADNYGRVEHCESSAEVQGAGCTGGVVGSVQPDPASTVVPLIARCKNRGTVRGAGDRTGGLVGHALRAKVVDCENHGAVIGTGSYTGGVVGLNSGTVRGCRNRAPIRGRSYAGGVAGANCREGYLAEIANEGLVQAETIGEIVGEDFTQQVVDEDVLRKHYHQEAL